MLNGNNQGTEVLHHSNSKVKSGNFQNRAVGSKLEITKIFLILVKLKGMKREKVIDTVNDLPQEFELEELLEKLVFVEKVESGLKQVETGRTIPHDQIKEIVKKW